MKKVLLISIISILFFSPFVSAKTIEIDVHGMTCAFCVDALNRAFKKMEGISNVKISMKNKKVRLEKESESITIEMIKQAVLDAGFTPTKVTVIPDEQES